MLHKLPLDIVLLLHEYLTDWNDRFLLATLHPALWTASLNLRVNGTYDLNYSPVNTLQLACSTSIRLPTRKIPLSLMQVLIQYSYAATEIHIPTSETITTRFGKWLCAQIKKRPAHRQISLIVEHQSQGLWQKIAEKAHHDIDIVTVGTKRDLSVADLDLYDTPKEAKRIKQYHKQLAVMAGTCRLRSSPHAKEKNTQIVNQEHIGYAQKSRLPTLMRIARTVKII
ncbi:hypothetical protein LRAMOSA05324 [Lichtheimia ramosa]|uniref:Uncharacterized protein n=1 Tax=Lichtheimia ramosa TaxID=688394 RepID=A0A077WZW9_9FUNG|nr:hypothetical protein LRAMOSA05324 [Lichtheimia ramosa]